jgi:hypothetical protein
MPPKAPGRRRVAIGTGPRKGRGGFDDHLVGSWNAGSARPQAARREGIAIVAVVTGDMVWV